MSIFFESIDIFWHLNGSEIILRFALRLVFFFTFCLILLAWFSNQPVSAISAKVVRFDILAGGNLRSVTFPVIALHVTLAKTERKKQENAEVKTGREDNEISILCPPYSFFSFDVDSVEMRCFSRRWLFPWWPRPFPPPPPSFFWLPHCFCWKLHNAEGATHHRIVRFDFISLFL